MAHGDFIFPAQLSRLRIRLMDEESQGKVANLIGIPPLFRFRSSPSAPDEGENFLKTWSGTLIGDKEAGAGKLGDRGEVESSSSERFDVVGLELPSFFVLFVVRSSLPIDRPTRDRACFSGRWQKLARINRYPKTHSLSPARLPAACRTRLKQKKSDGAEERGHAQMTSALEGRGSAKI